jgi:hypothetical protein
VAAAFQDALSGHRGNPTLEIAATEGALLEHMTQLLDARPQWLCSLAIKTKLVFWDERDRPEVEVRQAKLSEVLPKQTNLGMLKFTALSPGQELGLDPARFGQAIGSLPSLKSLTLAGYSVGCGSFSGTVLADSLCKLPGLKDLDLRETAWHSQAFAQVVPSLTGLKQLQTLNLAGKPLGAEECSQLTASLAGVPTLQHLYLTVPKQRTGPPTERGPVDVNRRKNILQPLAKHADLHIHLQGLDKESLPRLQSALPALHIHDH